MNVIVCNPVFSRVYDVFIGNIQLLSVRDRVMKLFEILKNLKHASGEVILKAQYLTCTAFKGLSFLNQDTVAAEMYLKDETMKDYLGLEDVQLMTVFNRITALRDDQVRTFSGNGFYFFIHRYGR